MIIRLQRNHLCSMIILSLRLLRHRFNGITSFFRLFFSMNQRLRKIKYSLITKMSHSSAIRTPYYFFICGVVEYYYWYLKLKTNIWLTEISVSSNRPLTPPRSRPDPPSRDQAKPEFLGNRANSDMTNHIHT